MTLRSNAEHGLLISEVFWIPNIHHSR